MLHEDMQRLLGDQQSSTVSYMAAEINHDLEERIKALELISKVIDPVLLNNPEAIQKFINIRYILHSLFNGGVIVVRSDGIAIADSILSAMRRGNNYANHPHIAAALKDGKSTIGKPHLAKDNTNPQFDVAVPIRDTNGKVIAALVGIIDLSKSNFLAHLTERGYGKTGFYLLEEPSTRLIITGTDKSRIMTQLPPPGKNWIIDRHVQGFYDTGIAVNPLGVEVLGSASPIPIAGWFLVAGLPTEEAFAPIRAMHRRMFFSTFLLTILAGSLTYWMLRHQLSPMLAAVKTLFLLSDKNQRPYPLPITRNDEIGQLIGAFNHLLENLSQRSDALKESEKRFRDFFEKNSSVILFIDPFTGDIIEANDSAVMYYGYSKEKLVGMSMNSINTLSVERLTEERQKALLENSNCFIYQHILASGEVRDVEVHITPVENAGRSLLLAIVHDITERKQLEQKLKDISIRDPLTCIFNRRYIFERLDAIFSEYLRDNNTFSILIIDLDHFKNINDKYGHQTGDFILVELTKIIKNHLRPYDLFGRYGGEEFIIIFINTNKNQIINKIESLLNLVRSKKFIYKENEIQITFSGGISDSSEFDKDIISIEKIIETADTRLYNAKKTGRNKFIIS
jgi:diguanylate cyclase (GGDEF)-like protein/PAS domain S-box-containing protein